MGACGAKTDNKQAIEAICPIDPDHVAVENQYRDLLRIENPNNLNHKYSFMYKVEKEQMIGTGIKRTYGYKSKVPIEEIRKKRQEFWGRLL